MHYIVLLYTTKMDCFYCWNYVRYNEKRCKHCWVIQNNKLSAFFSKDKKWNYVYKKYVNFENFKNLIGILLFICLFAVFIYWLYHLTTKWHHMRFCWNLVWDLAWYLAIVFFVYAIISELFFQDGFKKWIKYLAWFIVVCIILCRLLSITWWWDDDMENPVEPRYNQR